MTVCTFNNMLGKLNVMYLNKELVALNSISITDN